MSKKRLLGIIAACMVVVVVVVVVATRPTAVAFGDANLEAAVRGAIGNPEGSIYPSDLEGLTSLGAPGKSIADLTGIEHCSSLTRLWLPHNQISDISPLASLAGLEMLNLGNNQISDISPLEGLSDLVSLSLYGNQISDVSPLVDNPGLGDGAWVGLRDNPLREESINEYIPALQARGVTVEY